MTKFDPESKSGWRRMRQILAITFTVALTTAFCGSVIAADSMHKARVQKVRSAALTANSSSWRKNPEIQIDPKVPRAFSAGSGARADLLVRFNGKADLSAAFGMNWHDRGEYVYNTLKKFADHSQTDAIQYFRSHGVRYQQLWIANAIALPQANENTFNALMTLRNVNSISIQRKINLPTPPKVGKALGLSGTNAINDDLTHIQVPDVWALGYKGAGTVVANIDAGVRYTHQALVHAYRGNLGAGTFDHDYNWFDPYDGTAVPRTSDAHGSHTMGIMVGADNSSNHEIGMAPEAKWIACIGFGTAEGEATDAGLLGCAQFTLAPTKTDGTAPDTDLRADVVNNSWGDCGDTYDNWYEGAIDAWIAAGVVPVFSNGNSSNCGYSSPPGLNTVGSPARSGKVLGIGATGNHDGAYATYSNWGPTDDPNPDTAQYPDPMGYPTLKPNVSAPGSNILSSGDASNSSYITESGTSMAAPHVAGLVALMENAAPCLKGDYATIGTIITESATGIAYVTGGADDDPTDHIPNEATGWGEINALAAVNAAILSCGPQGTISGTVTDTATTAAIEGARVEIHDGTYDFVVNTDSAGAYSKKVPVSTYDIDVRAYGYGADQQTGVVVTEGVTTTADFILTAAPIYTVSGVVTDAATGWPLHAKVSVTGAPIAPIWSDPVTGAYSVDLAGGGDYTLTASASVAGYADGMATLTGLSGATTQNLTLDALGVCTAPGYTAAVGMNEDFEGGSLPSGWSRSSSGLGWKFGDDLSSTYWTIPAHTVYAAANDDAGGSSNDGSVDLLVTPSFDFSAVVTPVLQFDSFFTGGYGQLATVEVSTDGGTSWTATGSVVSDAAWTAQNIDLSAYAGNADVKIRFHSDDGGAWASGWAIDNVKVSLGCSAPATGGLIVGKTSDANTGTGLNGAAVTTNPGSASASSFHVDDPAIGDGFYSVYAPEGSVDVTGSLAPYTDATQTASVPHLGTVRADLALTAGRLVLNPATGPEQSLAFGTAETGTLQVSNDGSADVDFSFLAATLKNDFEGALLTDGGWTVTSAGDDCVWMRNDDWGDSNLAGGDGFSADVNSDTCGSGTTADTSLVSPQFTLAGTSQAKLDFMLSYDNLSANDFFDVDVSINGGSSWINVLHQTTDTSPDGPGVPVSVDLGPYLGASHVLVRFRYKAGWAYHAQVDQVSLYTDTNNIPWFSLNPSMGTVATGSSNMLSTLFDASAVAQPGDYMAPLKLTSNTPYSPQAAMTVMHATVPASFGTLTGTVITQGYCDANPTTLPGAGVTIVGSGAAHQTTTDASGNYSYQVDAGEAPFTITATASGQLQSSQSGIALTAGGTTNTNVGVRLDAPCFQPSPANVSMNADEGDTANAPMSLMNLGAKALDSWTMAVGGDPTVVSAVTLSQSVSDTVEDGNSIACYNRTDDLTRKDHWLRLFDLSQAGFAGNVTLNSMTFGVETLNNATSFDVEARVYTLPAGADFTFANLVSVGTTTATVTSGDMGDTVTATFSTPLTVAGNATLVLDLFAPDGEPTGTAFFIGSNSDGESGASYLASDDCGIPEPTPISTIAPGVDVVLYAEGEGSLACSTSATPVSWLSAVPTSGSIAADGSASMDLTADATTLTAGAYEGSLCYASSDSNNAGGVIPVHFTVGIANDIIFQDGFEGP